jgi:hypothetical protein
MGLNKVIFGSGRQRLARQMLREASLKFYHHRNVSDDSIKRKKIDDAFKDQIDALKLKSFDILTAAWPLNGPPLLQTIYSRRVLHAGRRANQIMNKRDRLLQQWKRISVL